MASIAGGGGASALPIDYPYERPVEGKKKLHPTQFMLDLVSEGTKETSGKHVLADYMKREPGYDLSFSAAWFQHINSAPATNPLKLFGVFTKIHELAMSHITAKMSEIEKGEYNDSKDKGHSFCLGVGPNSDLEGVVDLIKQILFNEKRTLISFYTEEKSNRDYIDYGVMDGDFFQFNRRTNEHQKLFLKNRHSPEERVQKIVEIIKPLYEAGTIGEGTFPVRITSMYRSKNERSRKAFELMLEYFKSLKTDQSDSEKIENICLLCRELEQLHFFVDGNGRTVFIFANLLASWNNLPPFYPTNMCIFDANSLPKMVKEVTEGQERFEKMFGTKDEFNQNLKVYKETVENLTTLISTKFSKIKSVMTALSERNFNLLLRQSVPIEETIDLLKFLLQNRSSLNIDLNSAGQTSGTATTIAKKVGNEEAIKLLVVETLSDLISTKFAKIKSIVTALKERNFNLLLRQSAISEDKIELLKFLLENRSFLNIDLSSAGQTSGTAATIAKARGNEEACKLLEEAL